MSTHSDNVATHLTLEQEAKAGRKHTLYPNDDIESEIEIWPRCSCLNWYEAGADVHMKNEVLETWMLSLQSTKAP